MDSFYVLSYARSETTPQSRWELSWDVMEPIAYILGLFYSIIAYAYFLVSRGQVFDLGPMKAFWTSKFKENRIKRLEFDSERHSFLLRLRDRYKRHISHLPMRL